MTAAALLTLALAAGPALYAYYCLEEGVEPRAAALLYHRLVTATQFAACSGEDCYYAIPIERFEQHLRYLKERGFRSLSTGEFLSFLDGRGDPPERPVFITLDDGYVSALTFAQPLLKKHGLRATLFVTADARATVFDRGAPRQRRLSDEELRRLDPDVIDVQAHGLTHRALDRLSDDALRAELVTSKASLERILGRPIRCMAVPGNHYDNRVLEFARQAGYEAVFTSDPGSVGPGDDPLGVPRANVAGYVDARGLATLLDPHGMARRRFFRAVAQGPSHMLGVTLGSPVSRFLGALFAAHPPSRGMLVLALFFIAAIWTAPPLVIGAGRRLRLRRGAHLVPIRQRTAKAKRMETH
jgi:peptidoglycan/xylan/chitin deacetylase (PgdA/CDA1 family)